MNKESKVKRIVKIMAPVVFFVAILIISGVFDEVISTWLIR